MSYLPWWASGALLAVVTLGFFLALRRPLGISGSWARVVMWKNDSVLKEAESDFYENPKLFEDALMAATIAEFGRREVTQFMNERHKEFKEATNKPKQTENLDVSRTPWTAHLIFLVCLMIGGFIGANLRGDFEIQATLGETHNLLFGSGMSSIITLLFGGMLVGFGTQLGGGCTSGHGLSGFSRLVPASVIATCAFFGTGIAISWAMKLFGA